MLGRIRPLLIETIAQEIHAVRGQRGMLSPSLATPYSVEVRALTQAVRHNGKRFPPDFMFELTPSEFRDLKSQFAIVFQAIRQLMTPRETKKERIGF